MLRSSRRPRCSPISWPAGGFASGSEAAAVSEQSRQPPLLEPAFEHRLAVDLQDRHPQPVSGRGRGLAIDVDPCRRYVVGGQHVFGLVAEVTPATGVEQNRHPSCSSFVIGSCCTSGRTMAEPVRSIAEFLAVVRKSGLVEESRLAEVAAGWPDTKADLPAELPQALIDAGLLTHWQADQLRKGKHKGFMLGKYRLLRLLGAGGMSSVYLAENTTLKQQVAIKVLPLKRVEQSSFLARFEREAQAAFRLGHQNIARAFDLDTAGSIHFIVMEYIDGIDLHAKVKQDGPLEIRDAVDFIRQAAVGLHYAHGEGLVHRDIKPANLILDHKGVVRILDLGLALACDDDKQASLTREHDEKVLGTADYLAPEQATDSHKADRRSDIYALGCTLHYLLVGRAPFAQGKLAERIQAHVSKPPPNILDERPDVPLPIAELYFRMMEKHPDARPQTAQEVADALAVWMSATGGAAKAPAAPPRRTPPRRSEGPAFAPAPVFRHGPGSGGSSSVALGRPAAQRPSGPADSGSMVFTPPPASGGPGSWGPGKPPPTRLPPAKHAAPPTADRSVVVPSQQRPRRRKPLQLAGLPVGFWIALALGLVAVGVLATMLYLRNREPATEGPPQSIRQGPAASVSRLARCVRS
jgi:serine/threonine protein kinase